ncbi:sigma-70 family RNA polymerase sigma factor [Nakamurella lactea]|uniref:sigma-70 family RNA polymerase sigma factor n=1 Tax=Nakamurella lactea TaxID=459515 RepID=UPI000A049814
MSRMCASHPSSGTLSSEHRKAPDRELGVRAQSVTQQRMMPDGPELLTLARTLLGPARLLTGHKQDAEDLVADTIVAMLPRWSSIKGSKTAYARRALTNRFIDAYRRKAREPDHRQISLFITPDPADQVILSADLQNLIKDLSEQSRQVLVMRYLLDQSSSDVAATLGIPAGTVRRIAHQTLRQLANRLYPLDPFPR